MCGKHKCRTVLIFKIFELTYKFKVNLIKSNNGNNSSVTSALSRLCVYDCMLPLSVGARANRASWHICQLASAIKPGKLMIITVVIIVIMAIVTRNTNHATVRRRHSLRPSATVFAISLTLTLLIHSSLAHTLPFSQDGVSTFHKLSLELFKFLHICF